MKRQRNDHPGKSLPHRRIRKQPVAAVKLLLLRIARNIERNTLPGIRMVGGLILRV
ncbi:Uncharacterised protein [Salmonella enterica subsp. enterica serovar Bovismorbificans]|uniref:Uncharacterized protein n=1 Tax=Salmonella enterica subsp. enterica serovar Bovismorbificans TaxID=58097 RepID=A0A655EUN7_SALET|nr:Uncharacterised protein [Salmonella enterica subsp. enterica serovar Bovismorbificans]CNV35065.1 Uncharacterised protein [Salmonella enterica subsp. enterica serovar Bovismorbificans]